MIYINIFLSYAVKCSILFISMFILNLGNEITIKSGRSVEHTYYYLTLINHKNGFYYDKKNILVNNLHIKFRDMFSWVVGSNFIEIGPQILEISSFLYYA